MSECIFCRVVSGAIPSSAVYQDAHTFAFMDLNQPTRGHVLIVPKQHCVDLFDISAEDAAAVMETTRVVSAAVKRALNADGINLFQSNGAAAKQEVFHFHIHVFARYHDDDIKRLGMRAAAKQPLRAELDELAKSIAQAM